MNLVDVLQRRDDASACVCVSFPRRVPLHRKCLPHVDGWNPTSLLASLLHFLPAHPRPQHFESIRYNKQQQRTNSRSNVRFFPSTAPRSRYFYFAPFPVLLPISFLSHLSCHRATASLLRSSSSFYLPPFRPIDVLHQRNHLTISM